MYDDYFALLNIEPDQPDWAIAGALETAAQFVTKTYGDEPPHSLSMAIAILGHASDRSRYASLLKMSRNGDTDISPQSMKEYAQLAELTHFRFEQASDSKFRLRNLRIEKPPLPGERGAPAQDDDPPPPSPEPGARRRPRPKPRERAPSRFDELGCVNGQIPPLVLGRRVYEWDFVLCYLKHASRVAHWVQLTWVEEDGREFTQRDYLGPFYTADCYEAGRHYWHVVLVDTMTRDRPSCVYVPEADGGELYFLHSSNGLFQYFPFPWEMPKGSPRFKYDARDFSQKYPGLQWPPDNYFGPGNLQNNKSLQEMAVRYVRESHYWGYCHSVNYQTTKEDALRHSAEWVAISMRPFGLPKRVLRRHGIKAV